MIFTGVELEPGVRRVAFLYDPLEARIGMFVSVVTLSFVIALAVSGKTKRI